MFELDVMDCRRLFTADKLHWLENNSSIHWPFMLCQNQTKANQDSSCRSTMVHSSHDTQEVGREDTHARLVELTCTARSLALSSVPVSLSNTDTSSTWLSGSQWTVATNTSRFNNFFFYGYCTYYPIMLDTIWNTWFFLFLRDNFAPFGWFAHLLMHG